MNLGLLILRLVVGFTLAAHGTQKLFGWFGGGGIGGTAPMMEQLGFRPGHRHATLAGLAETVGGLFLAVGFLTPLASALVVAVMMTAVVSVHLRNGFFATKGGFEYNLTLAASAAAVAFIGPGAFSLDEALGISWSGELWGLIAVGLGLVAGGLALLGRKIEAQRASASATHS